MADTQLQSTTPASGRLQASDIAALPSLHPHRAEHEQMRNRLTHTAGEQASDINALFGFRLECLERLGEAGVWAWTRMNALFNWLPLAALVEERIVCMHGGAPLGLERCTRMHARSSWLPLAAWIEESIMHMHGGAPPRLDMRMRAVRKWLPTADPAEERVACVHRGLRVTFDTLMDT